MKKFVKFCAVVVAIPVLIGIGVPVFGLQDEVEYAGLVINDYFDLASPFTWDGLEWDLPPNTGRLYFRDDGTWSPVGLADAGYAVLDATTSTMSTSTWETLMSVTVDVPEATDRVLAHVTGQFAWMGTSVFVVDRTSDELCSIPDPSAPSTGVNCADLDSRITEPQGLTTRAAGGLWVVDNAGDELCSIPDPSAPSTGVTCAALDSRITVPIGLATRAAGGLWVVDISIDELCSIPDPIAPSTGVNCADLDSRITEPQGLTTRAAGGLWVVDNAGDELCSIPDPSAPSTGVTCAALDSRITDPTGLTTRAAGGLWMVDRISDELCSIPDPIAPSTGVNCADLDSRIIDPTGLTEAGADGECMIRLARGTTAVETLMIDAGRILLDTTFYEVPGAGATGAQTYSVQMMTANPYTLCLAVRGNGEGTIPLPSMFVQVLYGG